MEFIMKEFLFNYLQSEYKRFSSLINNMITHLERLAVINIINNNEKIKNIETLNDTVKELNDTYNIKLRKIQNDNKTVDKKLKKIIMSLSINDINSENIYNNLIDIININKLYNIDTYKEYYINDFNIIEKKLLKIGSIFGFYNIYDALNLLYGVQFKLLFRKNEILDIINTYYIPISYNTFINNHETSTVISKIKNSDNNYILENYAELEIIANIKNKKYVFEGYYSNESSNCILRTSQICNSYLFKKKKDFDQCIQSNNYLNEKFKNVFMKNINIGDIISYNKESLIKKIESDYEKYIKYSKMNFKNLMNEFTNNNTSINHLYDIIKLLLYGTQDCINIAGLLFSLIKDKKNGSIFIADIIYKNLNYNSQVKLKRSTSNIKLELDKLKNLTSEDVDMKKQIALCKNMPSNVKRLSLEKLEEMKTSTNEYSKQSSFVNILLNYPWKDNNDDIFTNLNKDIKKSKEFLLKSKQVLDNRVYGHVDCKNVIHELIGKWITNPLSIGKSIGLYGPAGVGKTLIAKGLGEALNIPFVQINLGGLEDGCVLNGHSYTYSSAQAGMIIKKMVEAGKSRCVMFFDELDKACAKHGINEIFNVLIHATDTNTNDAFNDKFFQEITFPINNVLFVFSYNDPSKIDKILLDRMEKIEVGAYSVVDKLNITNNFLLKEISKDINLEYESIKINDKDIEYIIDSFTFEAGVRELKRKLETLFLKLNLDRIYKRNIFENRDDFSKENPITLTREMINEYINKPNLNIKLIHNTPDIGIINGLFATTSGYGGIIPILIYNNYIGTKFDLKLTGSQGDVMRESVSFAFTTAMNLIKCEYRDNFIKLNKYGLHIHTPDGATPKDGPSAGSAFTTAFISRILNKKIRNDIAMTGEIEMNGNITEIGGLHYKLSGAKKAGVKLVFVPKNNEKDIIKIKENDKKLIDGDFNIKLVSHITEILNDALLELNDDVFDSSVYLD